MYEYSLWGAQVISDIPLNMTDPKIKSQLLEAKVKVDCNMVITTKFIINNRTLTAIPYGEEQFTYRTDFEA